MAQNILEIVFDMYSQLSNEGDVENRPPDHILGGQNFMVLGKPFFMVAYFFVYHRISLDQD